MTDSDTPRGPEGEEPTDAALEPDLTDILEALKDEEAGLRGEAQPDEANTAYAPDQVGESGESTRLGEAAASAGSADAVSKPVDGLADSTDTAGDAESEQTMPKRRLFGRRAKVKESQPVAEGATEVLPAGVGATAGTAEASDVATGEGPWAQGAGPDGSEEPLWATGAFGAVESAQAGVTGVLPAIGEVPRDVDMGPTRRTRWWVWALAAVAVVAVLGTAGYGWWWTTSRAIVAPDVVGKKPADATQTLNDVGLRLGKVSEIPTDAAPAGTIISQTPEAGSRLKPDDELSFVVAAAPEQTKVPSVVGVSAEQAAATLAEARLRPYEVASYNATVAAGFVVTQLPDQGVELKPGNAVVLVVSTGPAPTTATVPRTLGMQEGDAVTLLKAVGLQARVYRSPDASLAAGVVGTQTPLPGTAAAPDGVVQVLVSQGAVASFVTVPDVTGQTRKSAVAELKGKGLVPEVVVVSNATVAKGRVVSQMPLAGGRSAAKGTVGLLVSRGNVNDAPAPSVVGTVSAEASKTVTAAGFRPVFVTIGIEGYPADTIFAQYPSPGTTYPFRFPMVCLVAKAPGL